MGGGRKAPLPQAAADEHHVFAAGLVFLWTECPPHRGMHAEDVEEIPRDAGGRELRRIAAPGEVEGLVSEGRQAGKGALTFIHRRESQPGELGAADGGILSFAIDQNQSIGPRVRQRPQQQSVCLLYTSRCV